MSLFNIITQIRKKAKELHMNLSEYDDEDLTAMALNHLMADMEDIFVMEDENEQDE